MPTPHVIVVGAGIGGLTAALFAARADVTLTVLERSPEIRAVGSTLEIGPNAIRLVDEMGLGPQLRAVANRPELVNMLRWENSAVLCQTPLGQRAEDFFGAPLLDFLRFDLVATLAAALPDGVLRLGAQVSDIDQDEARAWVTLDSGETIEGDAVIAADGIRSGLREKVFGPEQPVYSGCKVYRGLVSESVVAEILQRPINKNYWCGPGAQLVVYKGAGDDVGVSLAVDTPIASEESWTQSVDNAEASAFVSEWDEPVRRLVAAIGDPMCNAVYTRTPSDTWVSGRFALLGDAAHAMAPFQGQGAGQAIEDSYVLGHVLRNATPEKIPAALTRYQQLRTARATTVGASSKKAGANLYHLPDGESQLERDAMLATLSETSPFGLRQGLWQHDLRGDLADNSVNT